MVAAKNRAEFTVEFANTARVLEYRDAAGVFQFTFDIPPKDKALTLEHHSARKTRTRNYDVAFARTREFLESCGYQVTEAGAACSPEPLTTEEVVALMRTGTVPPPPRAVNFVPPTWMAFQDDMGGDEWMLWIVAEAQADEHGALRVVLDHQTKQFGLATRQNVFLGFWGSLEQTFNALASIP
jgi:hypothetical protein